MKTNPNDSAHPAGQPAHQEAGLTKREYFAVAIYQGMSSIPDNVDARKMSAHLAVEMADELIIALNNQDSASKHP